jgi:calcineurin-like phosphoesterase family protein
MNYWGVADTHLGHNLLHTEEYGGRPIGFEETTLSKITKTVMPNDVLIHFGDVAFYKDEYWNLRLRESCKGKMWLVRGNHDKKSSSWYLEHGWDFVGDEILLNIFGKRVLMTHRPAIDGDYDLNIHGHLHNNINARHTGGGTLKHHLIFMEHLYAPISLRSIIEKKGRKL